MNGQTLTCSHDSLCHLCADVWQCQKCVGRDYGFQRNEKTGQDPYFYRFPSIIGCTAPEQIEKEILFVGLNPRCSQSNITFHRWLASSFQNFTALARNVYMDGNRYIRPQGPEPHYYPHMRIVEGVYGQGCHFEDHAAVTELFLCASNSSEKIYGDVRNCRSECAKKFLPQVLQRLKPKVIVAVGRAVEDFFKNCSCQKTPDVPKLISMPHPGDWRHTKAARERIEDWIVEAIKAVLAGQPIPPMPEPKAGKVMLEMPGKEPLIDDQDLPAPEHQELVGRVPDDAFPRDSHDWCINAERPTQDHTGKVPGNVESAYFDLSYGRPGGSSDFWKYPADDPNKIFVGLYRLSPSKLEQQGYIYIPEKNSDKFQVRFVVKNGIVYIQRNESGPSIAIGRI